MSKKIVVLTGSFNPITKAHRLILENAINKLNNVVSVEANVVTSSIKVITKLPIKKPNAIAPNKYRSWVSKTLPLRTILSNWTAFIAWKANPMAIK